MRIAKSDGTEGFAEITTEHSASSYGIPVIVIDGEVYGIGEIAENIEIVSATEEEKALLRKAGYGIFDHGD